MGTDAVFCYGYERVKLYGTEGTGKRYAWYGCGTRGSVRARYGYGTCTPSPYHVTVPNPEQHFQDLA